MIKYDIGDFKMKVNPQLSTKLLSFVKDNRRFILFILIMFAFRTSYADWNTVPTGSMQPTIVEGDRIFINKTAYDLFIPFTNKSIYQKSNPKRGDIVVFNSEAADIRLVKRVIGLPGETVEMRNNQLIINNVMAKQTPLPQHLQELPSYNKTNHRDLTENLLGFNHSIRTKNNGSRLSSFNKVKVPNDHFLVLGDNRDNSADSRIYGFVPRDEIIGKANSIVMSFNYDNYYIPRSERFFIPLK